MATDAPITGAPTDAREITGWTVSCQAADTSIMMDRITLLVDCITRFADDLGPIHDKAQRHIVGGIVGLAETIELIAAKARDQLGEIELDSRRLEPKPR